VSLDVMIAFLVLVGLIVYLIYSRTKFEKNIVNLYEEKFTQWQKHNSNSTQNPSCKELVALVFKQKGKISIELIHNEVKQKLQQGKFEIKES
jgi:hypothetical protein